MESEVQSLGVIKCQMTRILEGQSTLNWDTLAVEEALEIRIEFGESKRIQKSISITMRTPGHDRELAVGFLFTEGLLHNSLDLIEVKACGPNAKEKTYSNTIKASLSKDTKIDLDKLQRHFYTSSSCGVCGKTSIEALKVQNRFTQAEQSVSEFIVSPDLIQSLPLKLRKAQEIFSLTGGLHASGLFTANGELLILREDVGRHNALDKLIGYGFLHNLLPFNQHILLVSGRLSFELVQKAALAGIKMIVAIGAPSSLALELAIEMKMTLIGFLKPERFNIYSGDGRLK